MRRMVLEWTRESGWSPSNPEVRKCKFTNGTAPAADKQWPARGPEASCTESWGCAIREANAAWALADTEPATGGKHSVEELEEEAERINHTQPPNSIQHQSLLCIEVIKASKEGNIGTHHTLLWDIGVPSKVTLNSLNTNSQKKIKKKLE